MMAAKDKPAEQSPADETKTDEQAPASEPSAAREQTASAGSGLRYRVAYPTGISVQVGDELKVIPKGALLPNEVPDSTASMLLAIGHVTAATQ